MPTGTTTLIEFYRSLPRNAFYIQDHDADGAFVFPVDEGLAGITDWTDPKLSRPVVVLWNDAHTIALVTDLHKADPRCMVIKHRTAILVESKGIGPQDGVPVAVRQKTTFRTGCVVSATKVADR